MPTNYKLNTNRS